jgi:hypothetical protein
LTLPGIFPKLARNCPGVASMEPHLPISSEAEFEELLATALERERQRLAEGTAAESQKAKNFENWERHCVKETQREDEL